MTAQQSLARAADDSDPRGRTASAPWRMPLAGWKEVLLRSWKEAGKDNVGLIAAGVAFYAFVALVPLMGATVLLYGLVASPETVATNLVTLTHVMPDEAAKLIGEQLLSVVQASSGKKGLGILVALAISLFGSRNAAGAIITALNIAYEEEERRGVIKVTLIALAMTVSAVILALLGTAAVTALGALDSLLPTSPLVVWGMRIISALVLWIGAAAAAATIYRYAPCREEAKWRWLTPGSAFSAIGWLLLTLGFGLYVSRFGNYDRTYGSLGAVVVLLPWIYLSSYVFLFGAELGSEAEHQTERDTTDGAERPLGQRGAWSADHVADGEADEGREADGAKPDGPIGGAPHGLSPAAPEEPPADRHYLVSRVTNRADRLVGGARLGIASSLLATLGLGRLRQRRNARTGLVILAGAVLISLLRRED